ncbi:hypothetical protein Tcan_10639 [Toxocara canis]|uniref:Uncharacterized protein n=1 Tax=Toxocara canis TaxID=6265 RepID=A0A0B2UZK0_TOXCA|nr:hypothetical protein Tcan_10639 [Toxocara canis]
MVLTAQVVALHNLLENFEGVEFRKRQNFQCLFAVNFLSHLKETVKGGETRESFKQIGKYIRRTLKRRPRTEAIMVIYKAVIFDMGGVLMSYAKMPYVVQFFNLEAIMVIYKAVIFDMGGVLMSYAKMPYVVQFFNLGWS